MSQIASLWTAVLVRVCSVCVMEPWCPEPWCPEPWCPVNSSIRCSIEPWCHSTQWRWSRGRKYLLSPHTCSPLKNHAFIVHLGSWKWVCNYIIRLSKSVMQRALRNETIVMIGNDDTAPCTFRLDTWIWKYIWLGRRQFNTVDLSVIISVGNDLSSEPLIKIWVNYEMGEFL